MEKKMVMNKILLTTILLLSALNADVSICTGKFEVPKQYIECITQEANKTQTIEDVNFVAGYLVTQEKFDEAIKYYKKAVQQDDAKAMYYLGGIYEEHKKEYEEATKWYKKAAEKQYKDAVYRAGVLLEKELDKEAQAIIYYKEWVKKGDVEAYNYLGNLYLDKEAFEKAKEQYLQGAKQGSKESYYLLGSLHEAYIENGMNDALAYYKKAAEMGEYKSTYNLAVGYDRQLEYDKATPWYKKAMAMGNKDASEAYGYMLAKKGDIKDALKVFETLGEEGDSRGYLGMARIYVNEYKDYENEKKYALRAMEMGDAQGAVMIGNIYAEYKATKDYEEAIRWYKKAYEMGSCSGAKNMVVTYQNDLKDEKKYNEWLDKADAMGCGFAGFKRGYAYYVKKDMENAIKWYKRGADLGSEKAATSLGYIYSQELHDKEKAIYWYLRAYELGNKKAKKWIKKLEEQK
jgi:TPR repeat protein